MKRFINLIFWSILISFLTGISVFAEEAKDITEKVDFSFEHIMGHVFFDDKVSSHMAGNNVKITLSSEIPMGGIYIKYYDIPENGALSDGTAVGDKGFIHEYIPLNGRKNEVLTYKHADICDIWVYSQGDMPDEVQIWQAGDPDTDILLCSTHSDDDQLFFAGLLPKYTSAGANVRVAYFINHDDNRRRIHELLDGLWHCGVRNYPDISILPDKYSDTVEEAIENLEKEGLSYQDALEYQRYLLEKYRPLAVVLHDFNGEYGHGQHKLNTKSFIEAMESADEGEYVPKKVYVHLYEENPILLDIDTPLEELGGNTPFNVSQEAFECHQSQTGYWFYQWLNGDNGEITRSSQIEKYNPAKFGLYYSEVGEDISKNDILENIETYAELKAKSETDESEESEESNSSDIETDGSEISEEASYDSQPQDGEKGGFAIYIIAATAVLAATAAAVLIFKKKKR